MAKFNVNQHVCRKEDGREGVIKAREINTNGNRTEVKYLVDFGEGIENWRVVTRKDIVPLPKLNGKIPYHIKTYEVGDGKVITMAAKVNLEKDYMFVSDVEFVKLKTKTLSIGFSLYNGTDEYDPILGQKYAIHRCKNNPFTTMSSTFSGEFTRDTVIAIMDVKAKYIINNIDKFYRPNKEVEVVNGDPSVVDKK